MAEALLRSVRARIGGDAGEARVLENLDTSLKQPQPVAGVDFFAGKGVSQQPAGFENALALLRGLRRSARFEGFFFDPKDADQLAIEFGDRPRSGTLLTGGFRRSKLSPTGTRLGEPVVLAPGGPQPGIPQNPEFNRPDPRLNRTDPRLG